MEFSQPECERRIPMLAAFKLDHHFLSVELLRTLSEHHLQIDEKPQPNLAFFVTLGAIANKVLKNISA